MKPVFLKEMEFLGIDSRLEGYLWVDSRCYYGFNKENVKVKFGRALEKLPKDTNNMLTHKEYCDYHYNEYTKSKVDYEKGKFEEYITNTPYDEIIISVSGGKDSTVMADMCLEIAKNNNKTRVLYHFYLFFNHTEASTALHKSSNVNFLSFLSLFSLIKSLILASLISLSLLYLVNFFLHNINSWYLMSEV